MTVDQFENACSAIPLNYVLLSDGVRRMLEEQNTELSQEIEAAETSSMATYYLENAAPESRQQAYEAATAWRLAIGRIIDQGQIDIVAQVRFRAEQMRRLARMWQDIRLLTPLSDEQIQEELRSI